MVPVLAALSVCTLHARTCPPSTRCHSHLTTVLIQASSHRFSTWLTCVRTHARALARGILTFTHVPRQPLEPPRIGGPPLLALRICVRTHARVLARGILTLPHVRDNFLASAAPSACTLHTRTCPPFTCCHSHLTTQFVTKSRLYFDAAVHASFHWVRPPSLIVPSERIGPVFVSPAPLEPPTRAAPSSQTTS